jgi:hypothetical protein
MMFRRLTVAIGIVVALCAAGLAAAFAMVPSSEQLYLGAIAGCAVSHASLVTQVSDRALARAFQWKQWALGGPLEFTDALAGRVTALHVLIEVANSEKQCAGDALNLFDLYLRRGAPVDRYDALGYTPLHEAIIFQESEFVRVLLSHDASTELVVKSENEKIAGMNARELAEVFAKSSTDNARNDVQVALGEQDQTNTKR